MPCLVLAFLKVFKMKPLVSIITPFKNTEEFLPDCLNSIIKQTYKNWELILINDHSTDNSLEIATRFAIEDTRIKVFNNNGNGIIPALQQAFSISSGDYITRMDSDDLMSLDRIAVMTRQLTQNGRNHLAVGLVNYFSKTSLKSGFKSYETWINKLSIKGTNFTEIYKECVIPSPCWMIHRDDFIAAGGFNSNRYPEDYDLAFRFYKMNYKVIPASKVLHHWRDYSWRSSRVKKEYSQQSLLTIKIDCFLHLNYDRNRPLLLWGAGDKGKFIAKKLIAQNINFTWVCDNPKKINKKIYNKTMYHFSKTELLTDPQSLITVANPLAQKEIKNYFKSKNKQAMKDYFFFC